MCCASAHGSPHVRSRGHGIRPGPDVWRDVCKVTELLKTKNWKTARLQGVVTRVDDPVHSITVDCGGGSQHIVAYKRSCLKLVKPAPARPVEEAEEEEEPDSEVEVEEEPEEEAAAAAAAATEGDTDPHLEGWTRQDKI